MSTVWIDRLTWEEFQHLGVASKPVIIPVGSTEQHGPHLPLGTDSMLAVSIAQDAAQKAGAFVAPALCYGWSPHHMVLPGSVTVRPDVLIELLYDITRSLSQHGVTRFVYLNGHRIVNIPWLQIAADRAQRDLSVRAVIFDPAHMSRDISESLGFGPLGHAEEIETSHMLCVLPSLAKPELALDFAVPEPNLYSVDPRYTHDSLCYVPSTPRAMQEAVRQAKGATGCPTKATKEKGRLYHEHLVKRLAEVIDLLMQEQVQPK